MDERFHDPGEPLEAYFDEVLVRCPRCDSKAWVRPAPVREGEKFRRGPFADRRLSCASCALVREWPGSGQRSYRTGIDRDPWFDEPLWLRTDVGGHVLWAYNHRHLSLLAGFIAARHRTRDHNQRTIHTVLARLPGWMKEARHRDELLAAIERLRAQ